MENNRIFYFWKYKDKSSYDEGYQALEKAHNEALTRMYENANDGGGNAAALEKLLNNFLSELFDANASDGMQNVLNEIHKATIEGVRNGDYEGIVGFNGLNAHSNGSMKAQLDKAIKKANAEPTSEDAKKAVSEVIDLMQDMFNNISTSKTLTGLKSEVQSSIKSIRNSINRASKNKNGISQQARGKLEYLYSKINAPANYFKGMLGEVIVAAAINYALNGVTINELSNSIKKSWVGTKSIVKTGDTLLKKMNPTTLKQDNISINPTTAGTVDVQVDIKGGKGFTAEQMKLSVKNYKDAFNSEISLVSSFQMHTLLEQSGLKQEEQMHLLNVLTQHAATTGYSSNGKEEDVYDKMKFIAFQQALIGRSLEESEQANYFVVFNSSTNRVKVLSTRRIFRKYNLNENNNNNLVSVGGLPSDLFRNTWVGDSKDSSEDAMTRSYNVQKDILTQTIYVKLKGSLL